MSSLLAIIISTVVSSSLLQLSVDPGHPKKAKGYNGLSVVVSSKVNSVNKLSLLNIYEVPYNGAIFSKLVS